MTDGETAADAWARLTAPLDTAPPVIITPAAHAAWDHEQGKQRAARPQDWRFIHRWSLDAREETLRLAAEGVSMAAYERTAAP